MASLLKDKILLGHVSVVENVIKIVISVTCLLVKSQLELESESVKTSQSFDGLILIGIIGFFLALRMIAGLREDRSRKCRTWKSFLCLSLVYQIIFGYCFFSSASETDAFHMIVFVYCLLDFFIVFAILLIATSINIPPDTTSSPISDSSDMTMIKLDLPPTYDEIIKVSKLDTVDV